MKTKELLLKEKARLEKQLQEIKDIESREKDSKADTLLDALAPEIKALKDLICFKKKGKITVEVSYDMDVVLCDTTLHDNTELGGIEADCCVSIKQPKGYNIVPFNHDDSFCNMGMDNYKEMVLVHPDLKKHLEAFVKARKNLITKTNKTAKKLGLDVEDAFRIVEQNL